MKEDEGEDEGEERWCLHVGKLIYFGAQRRKEDWRRKVWRGEKTVFLFYFEWENEEEEGFLLVHRCREREKGMMKK